MKGKLTLKIPDALGLKSWSVTVKHSQKTEFNISAFKVSNKRIILLIRNAWRWFVIHGFLKNSI